MERAFPIVRWSRVSRVLTGPEKTKRLLDSARSKEQEHRMGATFAQRGLSLKGKIRPNTKLLWRKITSLMKRGRVEEGCPPTRRQESSRSRVRACRLTLVSTVQSPDFNLAGWFRRCRLVKLGCRPTDETNCTLARGAATLRFALRKQYAPLQTSEFSRFQLFALPPPHVCGSFTLFSCMVEGESEGRLLEDCTSRHFCNTSGS